MEEVAPEQEISSENQTVNNSANVSFTLPLDTAATSASQALCCDIPSGIQTDKKQCHGLETYQNYIGNVVGVGVKVRDYKMSQLIETLWKPPQTTSSIIPSTLKMEKKVGHQHFFFRIPNKVCSINTARDSQ